MDQSLILTEFNTQFNETLDELHNCQLQNRDLKQTLDRLQSEIIFKDKILHEKAMHITHYTSENIRLKQQIQTLKRKLKSSKKKKSKKSNNKKHKQIKPIPELSLNNNDELPYVMPEIGSNVSAASNLSVQACKISFPIATPTIKNSNSNKQIAIISILSPIAENNNNIAPITPMTEISLNESNNNNNIHINEWNESIADVSPIISETPSPAIYISNKNNHLKVLSDVSDSDDSIHSNTSITYTEYDHQLQEEDISYMTDNTHLVLDMDFGIRKFNCNSDCELSNKYMSRQQTKIFLNETNMIKQQQYNGFDHIITSPISMINLLETNISNSNLHNTAQIIVDNIVSSPDESKHDFGKEISLLSQFTDDINYQVDNYKKSIDENIV